MSQLIPQEIIESVRHQTNIVDVVSQYVQLKKSGKNHSGLCPFHNEKTPSFTVAEDKQIFHCFGCGKGGNVFTFLQEIEGLSFPEAVEQLADLKGIPLPKGRYSGKQSTSQTSEEASLIGMHEKTAELYHHILMNTQIGEQALTYLSERGLTKEIVEEFQIGFSPKDRSLLYQILSKEGYTDDLIEKSGLVIARDNGDWIDRFYQRIMFPITNTKGKTIGFSGRILKTEDFDDSDQPKYLNSPETPLFNKRQVMYHYHQARTKIRQTNQVYLFEGFMDVISASIVGVTNGVATMGTSLTTDQISLLERVTEDIVICYDGDEAGIEATDRAIQLIRDKSELTIQVVSVPYKQDPDDYRMSYGNDALNHLLTNNRDSVFQFRKEYLKRGKHLDNETDKVLYLQEVIEELSLMDSVIETDMSLTQLASEFNIGKDSLQSQLRLVKQENRQQHRNQISHEWQKQEAPIHQDKPTLTQVEKAEMVLIYRLLNERGVHVFLQERPSVTFVHDVYQELYQHLCDYYQVHGEVNLADFLNYLQEEHLRQKLVTLTMQAYSDESTEQELTDCLMILSQAGIKESIEQKKKEQQEAKRRGDKDAESEATLSIIQLQRQLKTR